MSALRYWFVIFSPDWLLRLIGKDALIADAWEYSEKKRREG